MASFVRIQWLHEQLQSNQYPNAKNISDTFEISQRQGQRDIEYLRGSLCAPIEYSPVNRGYFYTSAFVLPVFYLTTEEKYYLEKLSDYYGSLSTIGIKEYSNYQQLFMKLSSKRKIQNNNIPPIQVPYTAKIRLLGDRHSFRLLDQFYRGDLIDDLTNDTLSLYEFYNPELFIGLLIGSGCDFKIVFPNWLKKKTYLLANKAIRNNA